MLRAAHSRTGRQPARGRRAAIGQPAVGGGEGRGLPRLQGCVECVHQLMMHVCTPPHTAHSDRTVLWGRDI